MKEKKEQYCGEQLSLGNVYTWVDVRSDLRGTFREGKPRKSDHEGPGSFTCLGIFRLLREDEF